MIETASPDVSAAVSAFLRKPHHLFIGGEWVEAQSGRSFSSFDPATGAHLAEISEGDAGDVDRAVMAARAAFEGPWSRITATERANLLFRLADLIAEHQDTLEQLEVLDNGMPRSVARATVGSRPGLFRYYGGWPERIEGATIPNSGYRPPGDDLFTYTLREPVGVAGLIAPWNVPLAIACLKLAPALAAGCTVVLKPAELTPLSALMLAELIVEAGFPPGVVNIVNGLGPVVGAAMAQHPGIDKISFTGSTAVGKSIVQAATGNLKRVSLELGGKAPVVIFGDADLETTLPAVVGAIYGLQGQNCMAATRIYVEAKMFDRVVAEASSLADKLKLGHGLRPDSQLGPLISERHRERVLSLIEAGVAEGGELVTGGCKVEGRGHFVTPAVFAGTRGDMRVMREEIFGPVGCFQRFADGDLEGVAAAANDTDYGLAASVWTTSLSKAHRMAKMIRAGQMSINCHGATGVNIPFGGFKQSGWGREFAKDGLDLYLETKSVTARI